MKKIYKYIFILLALALSAVVIYYIYLYVWAYYFVSSEWSGIKKHEKYLLQEVDHHELLTACREVINNPERYKKTAHENVPVYTIYLGDPNLPDIIKSLGSTCITLNDNSINIGMGGGDYHYGFIAYREGVEQDGRKKLIDGLWWYYY